MGFVKKFIIEEQKNLIKTNINHYQNSKKDIVKLFSIYLKLENYKYVLPKLLFYTKLLRFILNRKAFLYKITFLSFGIFALFLITRSYTLYFY